MREMITFNTTGGKFNVRVAAVALSPDGTHVLIHRGVHEPFWTLPGGRLEMFEPTAEAVAREVKEELNLDATVERLLWIVEDFYTYEDRPCHEIAFYFLVSFPADAPIHGYTGPFSGDEDGMEIIFQWHNLDTIEQVNLLPAFLGAGLRALPESTRFVTEYTEL